MHVALLFARLSSSITHRYVFLKAAFSPNHISPRNRCMPIRDFHVNETTVVADWFAFARKQNLAIDTALIRELMYNAWNCVLFLRDNLRDKGFNQRNAIKRINWQKKTFTMSRISFHIFPIIIDYFIYSKRPKKEEEQNKIYWKELMIKKCFCTFAVSGFVKNWKQ